MLVEAKRVLALLAVTVLMVAVLAIPALAQLGQSGLVNVGIQGTNIAVPVSVAVAANVCDVDVALAASFVGTGNNVCDADAQSIAEAQQEVGQGKAQGPPPK